MYVSFAKCLEILWKTWERAPESVKNKHSNKFSKFLIFFENFRKSSEVFGNLRKKQPSSISEMFLKSSEIVGSLRKNRKISESSQNDLPTLFENFRKPSEVFGNARKTSETLGKLSNVIRGS